MLVENDLIALRTIMTGTHTCDYAGVATTGKEIATSVSHFFRFRDDRLVEDWPVMDTCRILVKIGAIPGVAAMFQQMLGVPESPEGIFQECLGTQFDAPRSGRSIIREESRAFGRRVCFDSALATGNAADIDVMAEDYLQDAWRPVPLRQCRKGSSDLDQCGGRNRHRQWPSRRLHLRRLHPDRRRPGRPALGHGGLRRHVPVIFAAGRALWAGTPATATPAIDTIGTRSDDTSGARSPRRLPTMPSPNRRAWSASPSTSVGRWPGRWPPPAAPPTPR